MAVSLWLCVLKLLFLVTHTIALAPLASSFRVAVFGGSGFIGRRVCETLVNAGCEVISLSRSGQPPSFWTGPWAEKVEWIAADLTHNGVSVEGTSYADDVENPREDPLLPLLGNIDSAICLVGNVKPNPEWVSSSFFGLNFDDDRLYLENGATNERACRLSKAAGADRCVYIYVSYETAKALEGPIPGYLRGKRAAEHAAALAFGVDRTVVVGPSLVYGGKRFSRSGDAWRRFVESSPVRAYLSSQDFLRNLSSAPMEDWLEKLIFSPPVRVDAVASVVCAGALGLIEKGAVPPRRQGFYDTNGKEVRFDEVLFVDGTVEIERLANAVDGIISEKVTAGEATFDHTQLADGALSSTAGSTVGVTEPPFEGGLIGLKPYLYPLPVVAAFLSVFAAIATGQFDALNQQYYDKTTFMPLKQGHDGVLSIPSL